MLRPTSPAEDPHSSVLRLIRCERQYPTRSCHGDELQNRHSYPSCSTRGIRQEIIYVIDLAHTYTRKGSRESRSQSSLTSFENWSSNEKYSSVFWTIYYGTPSYVKLTVSSLQKRCHLFPSSDHRQSLFAQDPWENNHVTNYAIISSWKNISSKNRNLFRNTNVSD